MADSKQQKFPSEIIDLPSGGLIYSKDSPLNSGKLEIKYMTAREEDILTSQNLIKKGVVIDTLLDSLILTKDVKSDNLILGDKNAVMIAARILAYGSEYAVEVTSPESGDKFNHTFNLTDCPFKELPDDVDYSLNEFEFKLPVSKKTIKFRILTGKEEKQITQELNSIKKLSNRSPEVTTRLKKTIVAVDGDSTAKVINTFVDNMLSKDSFAFREEMSRITPDIILNQEVYWEGETVSLDIPMTVEFFWPKART
jgi:hypothetical protein